MTAYAAAQAYVNDPNTKKRREINEQMMDLAKTHIAMSGDETLLPGEHVVWTHKRMWPKLEKLKAEFDSIPNEPTATPKRAKGVGDKFLQELADDFKISKRMVKSCINEFAKKIF